MTKKKKEFDAVKFMREKRAELSELYTKNPEEFKKRMKDARKKLKQLKHRKPHKPISQN